MDIDELNNRINNEFEKIYKTILIDGDWGIGKTYFLEKNFLREKDYIKISLFGINSIDEFKENIYIQINNFLEKIESGVNKYFSGNNISIANIVSFSIPKLKSNLENKIRKKSKNSRIIFLIDDLERKNKNILMEDILGFIENISQIENISIIIVGNIKKFQNDNDKKIFNSFKEKVIEKTYNVNKYSKNSINEILEEEIELKFNKISNNKKDIIKNTILKYSEKYKINNLRTIKKILNFILLIISNININKLKNKNIKEIIIFIIIIFSDEEINNNNKLNENTISRILNKYDETNVNKNDLLVNYLLEIYNDINIDENFKNIDKYFKNINIVKDEEEIELFYMSEIKLEEYINNFNNKFILTQNITIDIYIWFKELNKVLNYAKILNMEKLFNSEKIISTIDKYIENNKNIKPFDIMKKIMLKDSENYNTIKEYVDYFNKKAYLQYCNNLIDQINTNIKNLIYDKEKLNELFNLFNDEENVNKSVIWCKIKESNFFIIDLNKDINYESWSWCHKIWKNIKTYYDDNQDFKNYIIKILETSSKIGRYRIESLNKQYNINL